jgi:hypothetical protein
MVAERIRQYISAHPVVVGSGKSLKIAASVTAVCSPQDGLSLKDLLSAVKQRSAAHSVSHGGPRVH